MTRIWDDLAVAGPAPQIYLKTERWGLPATLCSLARASVALRVGWRAIMPE